MIPEANHKAVQTETERNKRIPKLGQKGNTRSLKETTTTSRRIP